MQESFFMPVILKPFIIPDEKIELKMKEMDGF